MMTTVFALIVYGIVALVISLIANWVRSLFTKAGSLGDAPAAGRIAILWLVVLVLPYGWVEFNSSRHKGEFSDVIETAQKRKLIDGELVYTKVQHLWGDRAKILVVTLEKEEWGGTYRDIYQIICAREKGEWELNEVRPINTLKGDSAGFVFPPYW